MSFKRFMSVQSCFLGVNLCEMRCCVVLCCVALCCRPLVADTRADRMSRSVTSLSAFHGSEAQLRREKGFIYLFHVGLKMQTNMYQLSAHIKSHESAPRWRNG